MKTVLDLIEPQSEFLGPIETIDSLIRHINLIKDDLQDVREIYYETNIESIRIRNESVKVLSILLQKHLASIL